MTAAARAMDFAAAANTCSTGLGTTASSASAEYLHGAYSFFLNLNMMNLYSHHDGRFTNINETRVRTAYGAIHGKVFLDYNGNHLLDPNEPGVPKVKVCLGETTSAVTDKNGYYILPAPSDASEVRVYLDGSTVPAMYTVTHGTQLAKVYRDSLTEVNLSLAPLISIVGRVMAVDLNAPHHQAPDANVPEFWATVFEVPEASAVERPARGVRVILSDPQTKRLVTDSITGDDGTYYLGDIKPGQYVLRVDTKTLSKQYELAEPQRTIEVKPTTEELLEIQQPDFVVIASKETKPSGNPPVVGEEQKAPECHLRANAVDRLLLFCGRIMAGRKLRGKEQTCVGVAAITALKRRTPKQAHVAQGASAGDYGWTRPMSFTKPTYSPRGNVESVVCHDTPTVTFSVKAAAVEAVKVPTSLTAPVHPGGRRDSGGAGCQGSC